MNWKILLVILLVMTGAGVYLARQMGGFKKEEPQPKQIEKLLTFDLATVDRAQISFMDTTYQLERHFDEWRIAQPYPGEQADSLTVNNMLRTLTKISVIRKIPLDSISLAQVNLDNPVLSFELHFLDGSTQGVSFGALNPTTDNLYVRRTSADSVLMVSKILGPSLAVNSRMIRSKQLINLPVLRVSALELEHDGRSDRLAVDPQSGGWNALDGSVAHPVDKLIVLTVLERLHLGQVREFHAPEEAGMPVTGLDRPVRRVSVEDLDGKRNEVRLGRPVAGRDYLLWASSTVYPNELLMVDSLLVSQLDRLRPERIPYVRLAQLDIHTVDRMLLQYRANELELKADSDTLWRILLPREHKARLWQVERILAEVDTMNALTVLQQQANGRGFEDPQLDLSLFSGDSLVGHFLVGDYAGMDIYFRDVLLRTDYTIPPRTLERLSWTFDDLADVPVRHVVQ
ncbi:DUF4340 domain-containing protein [bacterium]|nr:DUF4340 domain-containing protein [bacterium]